MSKRRAASTRQTESDPTGLRWGWIYTWLIVVFACILMATINSVERKRLSMQMDELIQRKLTLRKTLADEQVRYYNSLSFETVRERIEAFHLELEPSSVPPILLGAPDEIVPMPPAPEEAAEVAVAGEGAPS